MLLLVGLALLPLFSVAWFTAMAYRDATHARSTADQARQIADDARSLGELRLAIVDERNWLSIVRGLEDFGVDPTIAGSLIGLDVVAEYESSVTETDRLLAIGPGREFAGDLAAARALSVGNLTLGLDDFDRVSDRVGGLTLDLRNAVKLEAVSIEGTNMVTAMRLAGAAVDARFAHASELWRYFRAEFSALDDAWPSYLLLPAHRDRRELALSEIERDATDGSELRQALDQVRGSSWLALFDAAVDDALDGVLERSTTATDDDAAVLGKIVEVSSVFDAGLEALEQFDDLVEAADRQLTTAGDDVVERAAAEFRLMVLVLIGLVVAAVVVAVVLARYIGRPMVRLAVAAKSLGTGAPLDVTACGPAEVRRVGEALEAAAAGLSRVERLEHDATHDDLTGVPSRNTVIGHLDRALSRARRSGEQGAVLFVDIDHFKDVNDTFGHAAGDIVLTTVVERIRATLRLGDELGRFGGDEFVVIAESIGSPEALRAFADRIVAAVSEPIDLSSIAVGDAADSLVVTVSIGATTFGDAVEAGEDVLRRADTATYRAKAEGRNRTAFSFDSHVEAADAEVTWVVS